MTSASHPDLTHALGSLSSLSAAAVLDQSIDCVKLIGLAGDVQYMNANGFCAMEIDDQSAIIGRTWVALWPQEAAERIGAAYTAASAGDAANFQAFCPTAKGNARWWDVSVSKLVDIAGRHVGYLSVSRDVTEQQQSREALLVAAAEMIHRLKNTYMMVSSLLTIFARGDAGNEAFAQRMRARLAAIGTAQALFTSGEASCDIELLVPALVAPFENPACRVIFDDLTPAIVNRGRADAIALVIGELSVNAGKHGALAHGGEIRVTTSVDNGELTIIWNERCGVPPQAHRRDGGQGLALIERIVAARYGRVETEWQSMGLTTRLTFPL
ncbi:MAG: PAS domain-containing protein [Sandarakinorhabdus sp.]|nr:PAS domain-containing protein [Sandarakinorhabdus sp.]